MMGTVAGNLCVDIHRFSLDVCVLTTKEGRTYALGVARSNPGASISLCVVVFLVPLGQHGTLSILRN